MLDKPTLSIATVPFTLQAFKAKIGYVKPGTTYDAIPEKRTGVPPGGDEPVRQADRARREASDPRGERDRQEKGLNSLQPQASTQIAPASPNTGIRAPLPFALITGAIYPDEPSWTNAKTRAVALNFWVARIAKEVGRRYENHAERDAATAFVLQYRLSIANAFTRRIVRADVVAALMGLFQAREDDEPVKAKAGY